ncbi:EAL domain-containing protein [Ferrimicrobium sp.]|uniref:putative bifunctional diguanylate cyclase/phosphodiesterase n=1 Tax=Ferrimicrobium sp. TaxID=2926050 RepID=UPI002614C474|nr:EAL domain-containing protein [Ferrimicrobium sp.]
MSLDANHSPVIGASVANLPSVSVPHDAAMMRNISRILAGDLGSRGVLLELLDVLCERFATPITLMEVEPGFGRLRLVVAARGKEFADFVGLEPPPVVAGATNNWLLRIRGTSLTLLRLGESLMLAMIDLEQLSTDDYRLLEQISPAIRLASESYRQERSRRWLSRRVRTNQRLLERLLSVSDTAVPWMHIGREARLLTGAHSALVVEVRPNATWVAAAIGETMRQPGDIIDRHSGLLAWVGATGVAVLIGSLADRTTTDEEAIASIRGETENDSAVVVPIVDTTATLVALIAVFSPSPYRFSLRDFQTIRELARFAGAIVSQRQTLSFVVAGQERSALASQVLDFMPDGVALVDDEEVITLHNRAFARLHGGEENVSLRGMLASQFESKPLRTLSDQGAQVEEEERLRLDGSTFVTESYRRRFIDAASGVTGTLLAVRDIQERNVERRRVRQLAHMDPLTGLNNRAGFFEHANAYFDDDEEKLVGVLFIDVDGLKVVNDQFGHAIGDRVLTEVANRIRTSVRPLDVVGRIGGDEFAVLVIGMDSSRVIRQLADRLAAAISFNPITVGTIELRVTAAVGMATGSTTTVDLDQLMSAADSAMYQDKFSRRRPDLLHLHRGTQDAVEIELGPDLVRVLRGDERGGALLLRFQPLFATQSGSVTGAETLVRWQHPTEGLLLPGRFLSLALQYRLMDQLDAFVRAEALTRFSRWRSAGLAGQMRLSVNLSGVNAAEGRTVKDFCQLADRLGVPRDMVVIELTETELSDLLIDRIARMMRRLKSEGFLIALDDFGVGTSSFRHLQIMPVDIVKIDRQFVKDLGTGGDRGLVAGLTALAGELGISVVAEGVGDQACLDVLKELGVPEVQGFHLARPLREAALLKLLGRDESFSTRV